MSGEGGKGAKLHWAEPCAERGEHPVGGEKVWTVSEKVKHVIWEFERCLSVKGGGVGGGGSLTKQPKIEENHRTQKKKERNRK